jgi:hypothetical protein
MAKKRPRRPLAMRGTGALVMHGGYAMNLTPPTTMTFLISMVLAVLAIVGQFVSLVSNYIPISMFWLAIVAYIVLFLGNVVRGF